MRARSFSSAKLSDRAVSSSPCAWARLSASSSACSRKAKPASSCDTNSSRYRRSRRLFLDAGILVLRSVYMYSCLYQNENTCSMCVDDAAFPAVRSGWGVRPGEARVAVPASMAPSGAVGVRQCSACLRNEPGVLRHPERQRALRQLAATRRLRSRKPFAQAARRSCRTRSAPQRETRLRLACPPGGPSVRLRSRYVTGGRDVRFFT